MKRILLAFALILIVSPAIAEESLQESENRLIEAFEFLTKNYLYEIDSEELVNKLIIQMIINLDINTKFLKPDRAKRHLNNLHGVDNVYVKSQLVGKNKDILYSRIKLFGTGVSKQLTSDILDFSTDKAIKGLILDLRHNFGGWLKESIAMVDMFITNGLILEERGRDGEVDYRAFAKFRMIMSKQIPIIILIDENTASAAEIVASALKDHNRAILLGVLSFGKATVQEYETFNNGSTLWVTSQRYYTKSGIEIHGNGVAPHIEFIDTDIIVTFGPNDSPVKKAITLLTLVK